MNTARNELTVAGKALSDFGVYISGEGTYKAPEKDYEFVSVAGRSGDLVFDNYRFKNIEITYPAFIVKNFDSSYFEMVSYLLSCSGYVRIEDTYHPEYYRLGVFSGPVEPEMTSRLKQGSFDLTFDCKPQKFLISGEEKVTFTADGTIFNPTRFAAKPLLRIYGTGEVMIGSQTITVTKADEYTDIDCEAENAYKDDAGTNCNADIEITGDSFPVLQAGSTGIKLGTGITQVEITPCWWTV